jgi:hypothetical protein
MAIKALPIKDSEFTGQELWSESQFLGDFPGDLWRIFMASAHNECWKGPERQLVVYLTKPMTAMKCAIDPNITKKCHMPWACLSQLISSST